MHNSITILPDARLALLISSSASAHNVQPKLCRIGEMQILQNSLEILLTL